MKWNNFEIWQETNTSYLVLVISEQPKMLRIPAEMVDLLLDPDFKSQTISQPIQLKLKELGLLRETSFT